MKSILLLLASLTFSLAIYGCGADDSSLDGDDAAQLENNMTRSLGEGETPSGEPAEAPAKGN
jgi:hypothetical protein